MLFESGKDMSGTGEIRIRADFNGIFGDLLCLSHKETCADADGRELVVREGMIVTAFDDDIDDAGQS